MGAFSLFPFGIASFFSDRLLKNPVPQAKACGYQNGTH
jgi:hypothetical protein